jgi:hypothetical protein
MWIDLGMWRDGPLAEAVIHESEFTGQSKFQGINGRLAAVYPIAILFGRCVGEMLAWSSLENIGRLF